MAKLTGKGLVEFAIGKIGVPYVYGAKGSDGIFTATKLDWLARNYPDIFTVSYIAKAKKLIGKVCCDCSGLISWYTGKVIGSSQLYSTASKRGLIKDVDKAPTGAVLWKSGHVGVYIGDGYCIEEKGIDFGCVKSKISNTKFTHWLTFNYMDYDNVNPTVVTTSKQTNPHTKPIDTVKYGDEGVNVKWIQWELIEAGFTLDIDGEFGDNTLKCVKEFQKSCKLTVDGLVGTNTIKAFVNDK